MNLGAFGTVSPLSMFFIMQPLFLPLKLIYSEKATKVCEIFALLLTVCTVVKSKMKILKNFVAFSEYMNFTLHPHSKN